MCTVLVGRGPNPCLQQQQDTIPYAVKISVLRSWRWAKDCPKHVELILETNKLLLLHLVGSSVLLYLHWWCTVKHKSNVTYCSVSTSTMGTRMCHDVTLYVRCLSCYLRDKSVNHICWMPTSIRSRIFCSPVWRPKPKDWNLQNCHADCDA